MARVGWLGAARQVGGCGSDQGSKVVLRMEGSERFGGYSAGMGVDLRNDEYRG